MKGKMLNVRGENVKKISENKEIAEIKKILGLESGKVYNSIEDVYKNLRYGKVLFMTDQDLDGSHIKGLGINLFQSEWASLTEIPGFIGFMNTPILKAKKGTKEMEKCDIVCANCHKIRTHNRAQNGIRKFL
jgi:DNA topoisomerase-2